MSTFRNYAIGLVLGAGALLVANASEAKVPVAPLKSATPVTQVAQGCGPGGFRDPYGRCHYGGYGHGYGYRYGYGHGYGYGYGGPINPDPHCTYAGCCPLGWSVQGGVCKPYRGY
jgi:hypothetical protein